MVVGCSDGGPSINFQTSKSNALNRRFDINDQRFRGCCVPGRTQRRAGVFNAKHLGVGKTGLRIPYSVAVQQTNRRGHAFTGRKVITDTRPGCLYCCAYADFDVSTSPNRKTTGDKLKLWQWNLIYLCLARYRRIRAEIQRAVERNGDVPPHCNVCALDGAITVDNVDIEDWNQACANCGINPNHACCTARVVGNSVLRCTIHSDGG